MPTSKTSTAARARKPDLKKPPSDISAGDFLKMAKEFGVDKNALFLSALDTYALQLRVIGSIRLEIDKDGPTVEKEYVKGRENLYTHPCIKELPRHVDSANKTALLILSIIKDLGCRVATGGDEFDDF